MHTESYIQESGFVMESDISVFWKFTLCVHHGVTDMLKTMTNELSVHQIQLVSKGCEFLLGFGLYSLLDESLAGALIQHLQNADMFKVSRYHETDRCQRLDLLSALFDWMAMDSRIEHVLRSQFTASILACHVQLGFGEKMLAGRQRLHRFVTAVPMGDLLRTLLHLQGASVKWSSPCWLKRSLSLLLTEQLLQPAGVSHLLRIAAEVHDKGDDGGIFEPLAKLLARAPRSGSRLLESKQQYYLKTLAPQLQCVLQSGASRSSCAIASFTVSLLLSERLAAPIGQQVFQQIMQPLVSLQQPPVLSSGSTVLLSGKDLSLQMRLLFHLTCSLHTKGDPVFQHLMPFCSFLFRLLCFVHESVWPMKQLVVPVLANVTDHLPVQSALELLDTFIDLPATQSALCKFRFSEDANVEVIKVLSESEQASLPQVSHLQRAKPLKALILALKDSLILEEIFLHLMRRQRDVVIHTVETEPHEASQAENQHAALIFTLLADLTENVPESRLLENLPRIVDFLHESLNHITDRLAMATDDDTLAFYSESLSLSLSLLTTVVYQDKAQLQVSCGERLQQLVPLLQQLASSDVLSSQLTEMANDLQILLATRGAVRSELLSIKRQQQQQQQQQQRLTAIRKKPTLIEELEEDECDVKQSKMSTDRLRMNEDAKQQEQVKPSLIEVLDIGDEDDETMLAHVMEQLCDALVPVRGVGLLSLRRLLNRRSPALCSNSAESKQRRTVLLGAVREALRHSDSYIYLAAVQSLAALAAFEPDQVFSQLLEELHCYTEAATERSVEERLKLGEVVVRVAVELHQLLPYYRERLLTCLLTGCRHDPSSLVRASRATALATLCAHLGAAATQLPCAEMVSCATGLLSEMKDGAVRAAGAELAKELVRALTAARGLEGAACELRELRRVLHSALRSEERRHEKQDETKVELQIRLALNELDDVVREALTPSPALQKKITVLDAIGPGISSL